MTLPYFVGIHAREWISPAVAAFLIMQLAEDPDKESSKYLERANIHVLPVANPDGYEYSRQSVRGSSVRNNLLLFTLLTDTFFQTETRLWRKNRRRFSEHEMKNASSQSCLGVDLNRNFGFKFGGDTYYHHNYQAKSYGS